MPSIYPTSTVVVFFFPSSIRYLACRALAVLRCALNEFNHSVQRFPSVAEYEAARANYLEDIVTREALVEDAITGEEGGGAGALQ